MYTTFVRFRLLPPLPNNTIPIVDLEAQEQLIQETSNRPQEIFEPSRQDSERRKALALQAVQDRLQKKQTKH